MPTISRPASDAADVGRAANGIRVAGVSKSFGAGPVLDDVTIDIAAGELIALLGPSGSGKTTLLRIIAGLEAPTRGRIFFGAQDVTDTPVQQRGVGFVFQNYALFKHMSVAENVAYGLKARARRLRPPAAEIRRRVTDLLDLVRLPGLAARYPAQLSGGQRQRVALARALAIEPRVLLLDEPFGALDAQVRKELRRWLRDLHERTGQTTLFVTHDQDEALEVSDRVVVLADGRLQQVGTPDDVENDPASARAFRFLGDALEIDAIVDNGTVHVGGRPTPVRTNVAAGPAKLFTRPWHVDLVGPGTAHLDGIVRHVHHAQGRQRVEIDVAGRPSLGVECAEDPRVTPGQAVGLRIMRGHVFAD